MRFYEEVVAQESDSERDRYHYHEWSPESVQTFWEIAANNPFLRRQFYPSSYWTDLIAWGKKHLDEAPATIVDVGCGAGNLLECLRARFPAAVVRGIDLSEEGLVPVRERFRHDGRMEFRVGTITDLPLDDACADLVTCTEVLEHTFRDVFHASFAEVRRVLRPGGHYLATLPLNERASFVCCPECRAVFTPHQHMVFEITTSELDRLLDAHGLERIGFYRAVDHSEPNGIFRRAAKKSILKAAPALAARLFPKAGTTGFLARRIS